MHRIVFDIETVGVDLAQLDQTEQDYFLRFADTPEKVKEAQDSLNCYPLTAQIVAIAMVEVETGRGAVYYQHGIMPADKRKDGDVLYIPGSEPEILRHFWRQMQRYGQFITFNGRSFDCPFIMLRSAMHEIPAGRNLVPYRYSFSEHVDLLDQLSFYDALRRKFSLHLWCKAFAIPSPKAEGVSGLLVKELFTQGKYDDIARYCLRDVLATKELFLRWEKCLRG